MPLPACKPAQPASPPSASSRKTTSPQSCAIYARLSCEATPFISPGRKSGVREKKLNKSIHGRHLLRSLSRDRSIREGNSLNESTKKQTATRLCGVALFFNTHRAELAAAV